MSRLRLLFRRYGFEILLVLAALEGAVEVSTRDDTQWYSAPIVALVVLVLLLRNRFPFAAPVAVWVLAPVFSFIDGQAIVSTFGVYAGGIAAAFLLGQLPDGVQARLCLIIILTGAAIVVYNHPSHDAGDFIFVPAVFAIAWLAGFALRARTARAEEAEQRAVYAELQRESAARLAVAEERARIARELHDVVAHSVSVMVLQVGAVRHGLPEALADDKDALRAVERAGRAALSEMRHLLGTMRDEGRDVEFAPQPGLSELDALLADVGRSGLPVQLSIEGTESALPRAIDLSAYRIIQEGLTNSLKHARAHEAVVTLRWGARELCIEVRDDGAGSPHDRTSGYGLIGVAERVKIYGGEMSASPLPEGGFVLSARLPIDGGQR